MPAVPGTPGDPASPYKINNNVNNLALKFEKKTVLHDLIIITLEVSVELNFCNKGLTCIITGLKKSFCIVLIQL